jgi:hypothetical protein
MRLEELPVLSPLSLATQLAQVWPFFVCFTDWELDPSLLPITATHPGIMRKNLSAQSRPPPIDPLFLFYRADCSKADVPGNTPEHNGLTQFGRVS